MMKEVQLVERTKKEDKKCPRSEIVIYCPSFSQNTSPSISTVAAANSIKNIFLLPESTKNRFLLFSNM